MEVKIVNVNDLKPHPKNPRIHPDSAIEKLERSIKEFGWTNPILVSKDGYILAGHARFKAAKKAGMEEVPVIYLPLEGAKAEAYMIADNRLQEETEWDKELLKELVRQLDDDIDSMITGFEGDEIDKLLGELEVEKEEPEIEFTEELLEESQYVVLYFDNVMDWQVAQELFEIKTVKALDSREGYERKGIGRVLRGGKYLEWLRSPAKNCQ